MGTKEDKQRLKDLLEANKTGLFGFGDGLYLRIRGSGKPNWEFRYSVNRNRRQLSLGPIKLLTLKQAQLKAGVLGAQIATEGADPVAERHREQLEPIQTVEDLFNDWHQERAKRIKFPDLPRRNYERDIQSLIGPLTLNSVTPRDVRAVLHKIMNTNRPSVANDALVLMKQLFNHGIKLDVMPSNPASVFTTTDAGGIEKSRDRILNLDEFKYIIHVFQTHTDQFTRENYLAFALLLCLGVRKMELLAAPWSEFDLEKRLWELPKDRTKTGSSLTIPLPNQIINWLEELKVRACNSDYVFPRRRASKRYPHMGPDTLNVAITKLIKQGKIQHFTVHDLRRTLRSMLSSIGTPPHVAERCLNHSLNGVEAVYDRYDYLDERLKALNKVAELIAPLVDQPTLKE